MIRLLLNLDRKPPAMRALALAGLLTAGASGARLVAGTLAPDVVPFAPYFLSTFLAALLGGGLAGAAALAASTLAAWYFFLPPVWSLALSGSSAINLILFVATQAAVVAVGAAFRRALVRASSAEAVLRAIFEQMPIAAFVLDAPSGGVSLATPQAAELLRGQRQEGETYSGRHQRELWRKHPAMRALLDGENVERESMQMVQLDGEVRHLEVSARPVMTGEGEIRAAVCAAFDVTLRQRAEESWHAKAAALEAVMMVAPIGVWFTYDSEVRQVTRNRFASDLLRAPHDSDAPLADTTAKRLAHVTLHRDGQPVAAEQMPLQRALRGEESSDEEFEAVFNDGTSAYLVSNARPLRDKDGRIVGAVSASLDIIARKRTEMALRDAIEQQQLLQREADHRIKNSLQLVTSVLRLQKSRASTPEVSAVLDDAITRVWAVAEAHGALHSSSDLRVISVAPMLSNLCRHVGRLNPLVSIHFTANADAVLDSDRAIPLGLVLSELLTNASRHAYPDGAVGRVDVSLMIKATSSVEVQVQDYGVGMSDGSARPNSLGTALVKSLAARIGAEVEICTEPGKGTRTTLRVELEDRSRLVA
jgi:PAS domain S-box-containing protein